MESGQYGKAGNNNAMELESTNYTAVLLKDIGKQAAMQNKNTQEQNSEFYETESISNTQSVTMSETGRVTRRLHEAFKDVDEDLNAKEIYDSLLNKINVVAEVEFRKKKTPNSSKPIVCWWNDKCKKAIDNRKDALGKYKSDPTLENFIRYKRISAETKKTFKSAARQSWKNFCESLNQDTPTDRIWKKLKAIKGQPSHNQPIPDVILEELLYKLALYSTELNFRSEPQTNHILCEPFNYEELERALKNNSNTSPGADDIRYPMIQHLPLNAKKILLSMFNKIYLEGEEVQELKAGIIIPITKPKRELLYL
ncbi:hypothetical protein QE152_g14171 [Popillia japonica]|uniref:Uncharacterized protein n=1 Tax=Popillia japonica TaxID=7064 RepID=A0AAW1L7U7_POPJA